MKVTAVWKGGCTGVSLGSADFLLALSSAGIVAVCYRVLEWVELKVRVGFADRVDEGKWVRGGERSERGAGRR